MKRNLRVGEGYTLFKHQPKLLYRYISLLAVIMSMCLYAAKQVSAQQAEPVAAAVVDTTTSVRDTLAIEEIQINTGYQRVPKERATGSFDFIDSSLFNRRISANVLDRIEDLSPGLLFDRSNTATAARDPILIRGRSTIFANAAPLIVLDDFPFEGNINDINPNDIASVSILKDAAAASIWGARAGNGVIVLTTRHGKSGGPVVQFGSNVTFREKPDLSTVPWLPSAEFIRVERELFEKGAYDARINNRTTYPVLSPVVELLAAMRDGVAKESHVLEAFQSMGSLDYRDDLASHFYQVGMNQQYTLNISGNTPTHNYYVSGGYDNEVANLKGDGDRRFTLRSKHMFRFGQKFEAEAGFFLTDRIQYRGGNDGYNVGAGGVMGLYPYARLVDDDGNAAAIPRLYRSAYIDTLTDAGLLDWRYRPLDEINARRFRNTTADYLANMAIRYRITPQMTAEMRYGHQAIRDLETDVNSIESFYTRDLINKFYQPGSDSPYPTPLGGIMESAQYQTNSHQGRMQLTGNFNWSSLHRLDAVAGVEMRSLHYKGQSSTIYGYEANGSSSASMVNFEQRYPYYYNPRSLGRIPNAQRVAETNDRFISVYANTAYTYSNRYVVSGSFRNDAANLIGLESNQRGTPLYSVGFSWLASNEPFYDLVWLPDLKFRATYGHNGNVSKISAPEATITFSSIGAIPVRSATIQSLPNERLRWERVKMLNIGIDFASKNREVTGTIEFYRKRSTDLLGQAPLDPTLGADFYYGNVANMDGKGVDANLTVSPFSGNFRWNAMGTFSLAESTVEGYLMTPGQASTFLNSGLISPMEGKPLFSVFSYPWHGLNDEGSPIAYQDGAPSNSYSTVASRMPLDSLRYHGPSQPTIFGSLLNSFVWGPVSVSFNISYRFGSYFRAGSINYGLLVDRWEGHEDYLLRWQQPGDEKKTTVPAQIFPNVSGRDSYYLNSEVLVEKADQIRLEDVRLGYEIGAGLLGPIKHRGMRIDIYARQLALLWKANSRNIDPNFNGIPTSGKTFALGISINL